MQVLVALEAQHELSLRWKEEPKVCEWLRKQLIFIDTKSKYEQTRREGTLGAMETATTSDAIRRVLEAEAKREVPQAKLGAAPVNVAALDMPVAPTGGSVTAPTVQMQMRSKL